MSSKRLSFGIVGVLIGFVAGFFVSRAPVESGPTLPVDEGPPAQAQSSLPEDHPSPEFIGQLQALQRHAEEHPQDSQARIALGNAFYDMGRFDAAIRWYEEAVARGDQDPNVITDLGTSYFYSGNTAKAVELFHRSLAIEKDHPQTLQNLGWVQFQSQNHEAAIEAWEQLIQAHPEYEQIEAVRRQLEVARGQLQGEHS